MAYYGEALNYGYDPSRTHIYDAFTKYFNNPIMKKLKNVSSNNSNNNYSMYISKINAHLGVEFRYLIVLVGDYQTDIGVEQYLSNLEWNCLQTRTLVDDHSLPLHTYFPKKIPELDKKIQLQTKDEKQYVYSVDEMPITISLLVRKKTDLEYNNTGTIVSALETYQTLVYF